MEQTSYPCTAQGLASYAVWKCSSEGASIGNIHLQKMLFFLQVVYCRTHKGRLLFEDDFEAWPYGPVVPSVYERYIRYGGWDIMENREVPCPVRGEDKDFVDRGITTLRDIAPGNLVEISHCPGSPWDKTYRNGEGDHAVIDKAEIIEFYYYKLEQEDDPAEVARAAKEASARGWAQIRDYG